MRRKKIVGSVLALCSIIGLSSCVKDGESAISSTIESVSFDESSEYSVTFWIGDQFIKASFENGVLYIPTIKTANERIVHWNLNGKKCELFSGDTVLLSDVIGLFGNDKSIELTAVMAIMASVTFAMDDPVTVVLDSYLLNKAEITSPSKEGFIFEGWSSTEASSTVVIRSGAEITYNTVSSLLDESHSITLFPVFSEKKATTLHNYFKTETLPEIRIATEGALAIDDPSLIDPTQKKGSKGELPVYNYVGATINVDSSGEGSDLSDVVASVKVRGNYTSSYDKKPIRIKFDKKQSLLGLNNGNKFKSWVLLAEWKDTSMLRNTVAGFIGNSLMETDGYYVYDFRPVKVYLNGQYNGVYNLVEQQQIDSNRINIPESKKETDGVKTGYFIEYDGYYKNEPAIQTFNLNYSGQTNGNTGYSITNDIMNQAQHDYIAKYMQNIWNVVYDAIKRSHSDLSTSPYHTVDEDGNYVVCDSTSAEEAISKVIDIQSLVDMFILEDFVEDRDIGFSSFNFSLDLSEEGDKRLKYVAPWDFDYAFGNSTWGNALTLSLSNQSTMISEGRLKKSGTSYKFSDDCTLTKDDFRVSNSSTLYSSTTDNPWLNIFANQNWFWKKVWQKWVSAKEANLFDEASKLVSLYSTLYSNDYVENAEKWASSFGITLSGYQPSIVKYFVNQRQASEYLKIWIEARAKGLDAAYQKKIDSITK